MTITSFEFLLLVLIGAIIYYIIPKSWQWVELLVLSLVFYYFTATPYTIVYLFISTAIAYTSTLWVENRRTKENVNVKAVSIVTGFAIFLNVLIWFVLKGKDIWAFFLLRFHSYHFVPAIDSVLNMQLIGALGMGYYTVQVIGYMVDCYWENIKPQKNFFKLFLFVSYFPQLTTGPISRYADLEVLFDKHSFKYENLTYGAQRILWGFVKKLVLAERVGIIVSGITGNLEVYTGFYTWIAILLYPIQMYADFSGCMDIILGVSEIFDIKLAENFRNPFFARTTQEFWQRWHITLGTWAKDYVLYPLLKSKFMVKFGKLTKKKFGKKIGKFLATSLGMLVLWLVMGIWHGGMRYIVGVSLWYWIILILGEFFGPFFQKITEKLEIKTQSFSWHLFQSIRTYIIYAIGATFFLMGISGGVNLLKEALKVLVVDGVANPWIFFDESILTLGVSWMDINIIIFVCLLLLVVGILREKYGYARIWVSEQGIVFRWLIWITLFVLVLVYGKYGPGYDASEFIYQGF